MAVLYCKNWLCDMVGDLFEQFDLRTCDSDTQVSKRQCCSNVLLDKFYTKISCVKHIVKIVQDMFPEYRAFVEPSAGSGNISEYLRKIGCDVIAYDIAPEHENIIKADYLLTKVLKDKHLTIGNPPFGYKGKLAIEFLNKALTESDVVAFIMPITALKYSVQKNILKDANLLYQEILPRDSFELPDKENYSCASVFQVWSSFYKGKNLRAQKPVLSHKDFVLYRHNATQQSARYIDCDWDFAVYAQGRKDYHKRFFKAARI